MQCDLHYYLTWKIIYSHRDLITKIRSLTVDIHGKLIELWKNNLPFNHWFSHITIHRGQLFRVVLFTSEITVTIVFVTGCGLIIEIPLHICKSHSCWFLYKKFSSSLLAHSLLQGSRLSEQEWFYCILLNIIMCLHSPNVTCNFCICSCLFHR